MINAKIASIEKACDDKITTFTREIEREYRNEIKEAKKVMAEKKIKS